MILLDNFYIKKLIRTLKEFNDYDLFKNHITINGSLPYTLIVETLQCDYELPCNFYFLNSIMDKFLEDIEYVFSNYFNDVTYNKDDIIYAIYFAKFYSYLESLNIDIEMFQAMLFEKCYGINESEFYADIGIDYDDDDYEDLDYPF